MKTTSLIAALALALGVETVSNPTLFAGEPRTKPVLLYSRYYNAEGENRYEPDGTYRQVVQRLREDFDVRIHNKALTTGVLADVKLLFIVNPSDKAVGNHPPPPHVTAADIQALTGFVRNGGGLIVSGNQENHNLEVEDMNKLFAQFGIQATNLYTDAKKLVLPKETPIIGGLCWAYYTGNLLLLDLSHPAKPRALVMNDLNQKPEKGARDQAGCLLATAEPGKGRVVVVTDSGWLADWAFDEEGIGGVAIKGQDNREIFRRLTRWAAHLPVGPEP